MAISSIAEEGRKETINNEQRLIPHSKRTKSPGVRIIGNRIYDSDNGKTCHQCRQKTMDFAAPCKNMKTESKQCTIKFCHKCLLNRYGEKAEEAAAQEDWKCPKCRGICNCSFCMKKKGHQPTGILIGTARANGFSSVSEMLQIKGHEAVEKIVKELRPSPRKVVGSNKESKAECKQLLLNDDTNLDAQKIRRKKLKLDRGECDIQLETEDTEFEKEDFQAHLKKEQMGDAVANSNESEAHNGSNNDAKAKPLQKSKIGKGRKPIVGRSNNKNMFDEVVLPQGKYLLSVAGVELPADGVGPALQFLEFCSAFGQVLDVKKGQAESILRELSRGRVGRKGVYSSVVQFYIKLLSLMQENVEEDGSSWFQALVNCISGSECIPKELPLEFARCGIDGYEKLDFLQKLQLLTFLCDEALGTESLRNWIEEENSRFLLERKEAKEEERQMKQKLKDEMAKVILASREVAELSISEHHNLVSQIQTESENLHADKNKRTADAMRTEPIHVDRSGQIYWRLRGSSDESHIILQDTGNRDMITTPDKWFSFDDEQEKEIQKFFHSLRNKKYKRAVHEEVMLGVSEVTLNNHSCIDSSA